MKYEEPTTMAALIEMVRGREDAGQRYCVYGRGDSDDATLDSECFLAAHPRLTDDDSEVYPGFVVQNGLELWYREELVHDVVMNALHQDASVSNETVLAALKHYDNRDAFLVIS